MSVADWPVLLVLRVHLQAPSYPCFMLLSALRILRIFRIRVKFFGLLIGIWVCLKMSCTPLYPMVLLIIIPMKNGYFIGNINPTFSDKPIWSAARDAGAKYLPGCRRQCWKPNAELQRRKQLPAEIFQIWRREVQKKKPVGWRLYGGSIWLYTTKIYQIYCWWSS